MLYLQIASPKSSVLNFLDSNSFEVIISIFQRTEKVPDMERLPQMNKGGKFIFGKSLIRTDGTLRIPPQAMEEYHIADEGKVYLFTGSKITGGFCVTRKGLLHPSKLGHILDDTPPLLDYSAGSGEFIKYKGRSYCWVEISQEGQILLTKKMMDFLKVRPGMELLSIRSSDIAFTMGTKGPLLEKAENYDGEIPLF